MVDLRLKKNQQAVCIAEKAKYILCYIRRFMVNRWRGVIISIDLSQVRRAVWDHAVQRKVKTQERVQQRL